MPPTGGTKSMIDPLAVDNKTEGREFQDNRRRSAVRCPSVEPKLSRFKFRERGNAVCGTPKTPFA